MEATARSTTCSPVITAEGDILIETFSFHENTYMSINSDGVLNWAYRDKTPNSSFWSVPAVNRTGDSYICSTYEDGQLLAFDKYGKLKSKIAIGIGDPDMSMIIDADEKLYVTTDSHIMSIKQGAILWKTDEEIIPLLSSSPALSKSGTIFAVSNKTLYGVSSSKGEIEKKISLNGLSNSAPLIDSDEKIIIVSDTTTSRGQVISWIENFDVEGNKLWDIEIKGIVTNPIVLNDSTLCFMVADEKKNKTDVYILS